jgi:plasmid maintenance system antidote protein VapI
MVAKSIISPSDLVKLEELYTLKNREEVLKYLEQKPQLVSALIQTQAKIRESYPVTPLSLEIDKDSETPTWLTLQVRIEHWDENNSELTVEKLRKIWFELSGIPYANEIMVVV